MNIDTALSIVTQTLWTGMVVAAPILGVALLVGVVISIVQVVTQIQEMTLTFVPKLLATLFTIFLLGHWMLVTLVNYTTVLFGNIPDMVK